MYIILYEGGIQKKKWKKETQRDRDKEYSSLTFVILDASV
jgi:hypothetical protein